MASSSVDLTPPVVSWKVYAGDRNAQQLALFATEGVPWDVTGCTFEAQARAKADDPTVALQADVTIDDAAGGLITVAWDGEEVRALLSSQTSWSGVYDLQVIEVGQALPVTLFGGPFTATLDVTKP